MKLDYHLYEDEMRSLVPYLIANESIPLILQYDFSGRLDLIRFIQLIHEAGLFVSLRIGPYICAEWNYGFVSFFS
jgi:hypothetical protein